MEENKKPGLELLEQLLKLKQWAMHEQEDDIKMQEVMKVQQPTTHHTVYPFSPTPCIQPPTTYQSPQQHFAPPPTIQYDQSHQTYNSNIPNMNNMSINANQQYLPQVQTYQNFQQATSPYQQTPQYVLAAPAYDKNCRICAKPGHYQRECPVNEMRKANGLPPLFLRAANNRNMPQVSSGSGGRRNYPTNNNSAPTFNQHLQQAPQGDMQRYQQNQRDPNRARDVVVRRFEGINGQVLNQEKAQIFIFVPMGSWQPVKGCLDSGATATVGGFQQHSHLCHTVYPMRKERYVVLPNEQKIRVTHTGLIPLKVKYNDGKENELPRLKIALVDSPEWQWVLIRFEDLYTLKATPDQALYASAVYPGQPSNIMNASTHVNQVQHASPTQHIQHDDQGSPLTEPNILQHLNNQQQH
eukprot:snap_masked-scaffold_8-processed-gene-8.51-mRNA-1 protein AED:1.00 eAED:1.00 QI:0/-1/0/0/-1/1/1/0/410